MDKTMLPIISTAPEKKVKSRLGAVIAFLLVISIIISSCSGGADTTDSGEPDNNTVDTGPTEDPKLSVPDDLPVRNFEGYEFRVISRDRDDFVQEVGAEIEEIGEVIDDAIYARNKAVEERFNVKIKGIHVTSPHITVKASVMSGSDDFDLMLGQVVETGTTVVEGNYINWFELPYVNLEKPWYINNAAQTISINNKAYIMAGEYCLSILRFTYCMFFNKQLIEDFNIPNPYETVKEGKWTIDYLSSIVKDVHSDVNGDGVMNENDLYGFTSDYYSAAITYQYAFDNPVMKKDAGDIPYLDFNTPKMSQIVDKAYNFFYENPGSLVGTWGVSGPIWDSGRAMFLNGLFSNAITYRAAETDFGIVPYPKFDESQERYLTMSDGAHSIMAVPTTVTNTERTGIVIEALNAESYKRVIPAYYEIALKIKYTRDEESVQALDMILDGRYFDFGYIYDGWKGVAFLLQDLLSNKKRDFASLYEQREKSAQIYYQSIIDKYLES